MMEGWFLFETVLWIPCYARFQNGGKLEQRDKKISRLRKLYNSGSNWRTKTVLVSMETGEGAWMEYDIAEIIYRIFIKQSFRIITAFNVYVCEKIIQPFADHGKANT